jgi:hypothetical protein
VYYKQEDMRCGYVSPAELFYLLARCGNGRCNAKFDHRDFRSDFFFDGVVQYNAGDGNGNSFPSLVEMDPRIVWVQIRLWSLTS